MHVHEFPNPFRARWWNLGRQEGQRLPEAGGVEYVILPKQSGDWNLDLYDVLGSLQPDFDSENVLLLRRRH